MRRPDERDRPPAIPPDPKIPLNASRYRHLTNRLRLRRVIGWGRSFRARSARRKWAVTQSWRHEWQAARIHATKLRSARAAHALSKGETNSGRPGGSGRNDPSRSPSANGDSDRLDRRGAREHTADPMNVHCDRACNRPLVASVTSEAGSARVEDFSPRLDLMQTHLRDTRRWVFCFRGRIRTKAYESWSHRSTSPPISIRRYRRT